MAEKRPIPSLLSCEINFLKVYTIETIGHGMDIQIIAQLPLSVGDGR